MRLSNNAKHLTRVGTELINSGRLYQVDELVFSTSSSSQGHTRPERVFDAQSWGISLVEVGLKDMRGIWFYPKTVGHLTVASVTVSSPSSENWSFLDEPIALIKTIFLEETEYDPALMSRLERMVSIVLPERCVLADEAYTRQGNETPRLYGATYAYENDWGNLQTSDVLYHLETASGIASTPDSASPGA